VRVLVRSWLCRRRALLGRRVRVAVIDAHGGVAGAVASV
jgi:hypothetical protein